MLGEYAQGSRRLTKDRKQLCAEQVRGCGLRQGLTWDTAVDGVGRGGWGLPGREQGPTDTCT